MMIGTGQNLGWSTFPTIDALPSLELIQMWGWCWWWFVSYDDQHDIIDDDDKDDDDNVCVVHERLRADAFCAETITNFPTNRVSPASSDNNCIPLCIAQLFWYFIFGILLYLVFFPIWLMLKKTLALTDRELYINFPIIPKIIEMDCLKQMLLFCNCLFFKI